MMRGELRPVSGRREFQLHLSLQPPLSREREEEEEREGGREREGERVVGLVVFPASRFP